MITFCPFPIKCHTELGDGLILYIKDNGPFFNDEFCIILNDGGRMLHMTTTQVKICENITYGIIKANEINKQ